MGKPKKIAALSIAIGIWFVLWQVNRTQSRSYSRNGSYDEPLSLSLFLSHFLRAFQRRIIFATPHFLKTILYFSTRGTRHDLSHKTKRWLSSDRVRLVWLVSILEANHDDLREIDPKSLKSKTYVNKQLLHEERTRLIDAMYLQLYFSLASRPRVTRWKLAAESVSCDTLYENWADLSHDLSDTGATPRFVRRRFSQYS